MLVEIRRVNSHRGMCRTSVNNMSLLYKGKKSFSCKRICKASPGPPACSLDYLKCVFNKIKWNFNQLKCVEKAIVKSVGILWMQRLPCPPSTYHGLIVKKRKHQICFARIIHSRCLQLIHIAQTSLNFFFLKYKASFCSLKHQQGLTPLTQSSLVSLSKFSWS